MRIFLFRILKFAVNWTKHIPLDILSSSLQHKKKNKKKTCIIQSQKKNVRVEHALMIVKFYINIISIRRVAHAITR